MSAKQAAQDLHDQAMDLHDEGQEEEALVLYRQALELDYARAETHYNIGLIYKYRGAWAESLRYNQQAVELAPDDEAANWNLAIAATALKDWRLARGVWQRLGMPVEAGDAPIEADFGMTPVRLNPDAEPEVVWARRIDPVRARILSIPYGSSGYCFGDIVLHDGAAVGYRQHEGREYSVFNVLELFQPGPNSTYEVEVRVCAAEDLGVLLQLFEAREIACEDWSRNVRTLCKQCSEGHPHEQHDHQLEEPEQMPSTRLIAVAGPDEAAIRQVLDGWVTAERGVVRLECVLGADEFHGDD